MALWSVQGNTIRVVGFVNVDWDSSPFIGTGRNMKNRLIHKVGAQVFGYFWLPCPACGQEFSGSEWGTSEYSSISEDEDGDSFEGICPDCEKKWETTGFLDV